jgi:hypothetical protein
MRFIRYLLIDESSEAMFQFKEKSCLRKKDRAGRLIILLSLRNLESHEAHPSAILIVPCSLDESDEFHQYHQLSRVDLTP